MSVPRKAPDGPGVNHVILALEISSAALLHFRKTPFLNASLASMGETLHCRQVTLLEYANGQWAEPVVWTNSILSGACTLPLPTLDEMGPLLDIFLQRKELCVDDTERMPEGPQKQFFLARQIKAALCIPIIHEGILCGGICFSRRLPEEGWSQDDITICHLLSNILAMVLTHFRLYGRLKHKHKQLRDILDAFPNPVCIVDMETNKILFSNKSIAESFPASQNSVEDTCHKRLMGREKPCPYCTNSIIAQTGEPYQWTYQNEITKRTYTMVDKVIKWDNNRPVRLSISTDITDILRTRHEKQSAVIASQAKTEFLAHMSHEIRTPLNGIIGLTHLALQSSPEEELKEYLLKIRSSSTNLLAIINDILDLSKIEANKMELENVNFMVEEVLDFVYTSVRFAMEQKGLEYYCHLDDDVPHKLWGDSLRLKQVLLNLVSNAVKFTAKGKVGLHIRREQNKDGDWLHFEVSDTGMGISQEYQQHLFDPYTQANSSISRRFGGTGLGLSICKRIVELMRGRLRCQSKLGEGSRFHLHMPYTPARNIYCETSEEAHGVLPLQNVEDVKILLVEDNEVNQEVARAMLRHLNIPHDLATNGREAVRLTQETRYDMILMDVYMPVMDGLHATREIRRNLEKEPQRKALPIIAMTAVAIPETMDEIMHAGMDDHLAKPFSLTTLRDKILQWLKID